MRHGLTQPLIAAGVAGAILIVGMTAQTASAATDFMIVTMEPVSKEICLKEADKLRAASDKVAGAAIVVAHVQDAEESCNAENYEQAEDALMDGYKLLRSKRGKGG